MPSWLPKDPQYAKEYTAVDLNELFDAFGEVVLYAAAKALTHEAELIMEVAKEVTVPIDEGILKGSGVVLPPEVNLREKKVTVTCGFGGAASAYSVYVHEDPHARHGAELDPPKPAGQGWKYLERPSMMAAANSAFRDRVKARILQALES